MKLTITFTATWRADLCERALLSLQTYVRPHFDLLRILVNIDPIYGDASPYDGLAGWFKERLNTDATLARETHGPSHGAAIKHLWEMPPFWDPLEGYFLHWEDDFEALVDITPAMIDEVRSHHCGMGAFWYERLGSGHGKPWKTDAQGNAILGTSPRFVHVGFGKDYAHQIDPTLCPEKQTYPKHRTAAWDAFMDKRNTLAADRGRPWARAHILGGPPTPMVRHLGHAWNKQRGITRTQEGARIIRADAQGRELS